MRNSFSIVRRPILTEKSSRLQETGNQVTFEVCRDANKIEIGQAVEELFHVKVAKVRTIQVLGKTKRFGRKSGKRPDWKKAIVTLKTGHRIDFFGV